MRLSPSAVIVLVIVGSVALALLAAAMSLMARRQSGTVERSHFDPPDSQRAYMKSVQRSNMNDMAQIV